MFPISFTAQSSQKIPSNVSRSQGGKLTAQSSQEIGSGSHSHITASRENAGLLLGSLNDGKELIRCFFFQQISNTGSACHYEPIENT